jgi:glutamine amidotransferase
MCELMALSFARPLSADFSVREFAGRDEQNADGWGLAWYPDQSLARIKEPVSWRASQHTGFLETYHAIASSIYIAHVRHKTVGGTPTHADTHPFSREWGGREYCFAHNGTLIGLPGKTPLGRYRPIGTTDSEYAFCHLLDRLAERGRHLEEPADWQWLHRRLTTLNEFGKLNCLFSDGRRLFCYFDSAGHKGLTFRKVHIRSHEMRRFEDSELQIDLEDNSINHGFVVATHPLSRSGWHSFHPGELIVFSEGATCYSSHRSADGQVMQPAASVAVETA